MICITIPVEEYEPSAPLFTILFVLIYLIYLDFFNLLIYCYTRGSDYKNKPDKYTDQITYAYETKGRFHFKSFSWLEEKVLNPSAAGQQYRVFFALSSMLLYPILSSHVPLYHYSQGC